MKVSRFFVLSFVFLTIFSVLTVPANSEIVTWDASSGLLPSDPSFPIENRFELIGDETFVSINSGIMNLNDDSNSLQVGFRLTDIALTSQNANWAYESVIRINSHSRPTLDWGADLGFVDGNKTIMLFIADNKVGFAGSAYSFLNNISYDMDTTNSFHTYRVIRTFNIVSLYVDDFQTPVISAPYDSFNLWTEINNMILLATSLPGIADYDVQRFSYNLNGTLVPEPSTISIDIKPKSCPNHVSIKNKGTLTVAMLGTVDLDVKDIDIATIKLEGVSPVKSRVRDMTTPSGLDPCGCLVLSGDGTKDLILQFDTRAIIATLGDVQNGDEIPLVLTGMLQDGTEIEGSDCVVIKEGKK